MPLTDRQWRNLIKDIGRSRCVLMLGPKLAVAPGDESESLLERLSMHLSQELEAEQIEYEANSNRNLYYIGQRFMTIPKIRRIDLEDEAVHFLNDYTSSVPPLYQDLASLPFHLVVNTSPDDFLFRAFKEVGKWNAQFLYYNFQRETSASIPDISNERPLIYNLFGAVNDPESLILTQDNQVDFIKNVVRGNPPIPNRVMSHFDDRKTYLFLGFDLERWEFRLLLDSLKLGEQNMTISPQLDNYPVSPVTQSFYEDRYQFVFVEEKISDFISKLAESFQAASANQSATAMTKKAPKVVVLFDNNPADRQGLERLTNHLQPLQKQLGLEVWHTDKAGFGSASKQLVEKIKNADLVLALLSADFFASAETFDQQLPQAIQHTARFIPVLYRPCHFDAGLLGDRSVLPADGKAITSWDSEEEAWSHVIEKIKGLIHE